MSLIIQIKQQMENQLTSAELFSTSPEKKDLPLAQRNSEENILALESRVGHPKSFKSLTTSRFQISAAPSDQQVVTSARRLIEKAKKIFERQGPSEEPIKLCEKALEIPFEDYNLMLEGLFLFALFHEKRARSEVAKPLDLDCAIRTQETLLEMAHHYSPIEKAKLKYMIARNVFAKALQEHDLLGVERTISITQGILAQDCLNDYQRVGLERNLAKAINARSLFEPKEDLCEVYLI